MGTRFFFGDENVLNLIVVVIAQHWEYTKQFYAPKQLVLCHENFTWKIALEDP